MSQQRDFPLCLPSPFVSRRHRSGWLQFFRSGTFVQAVLSTSSISTSMFRPLRSTVVTRFLANMGLSDSRPGSNLGYVFPRAVEVRLSVPRPAGSPRFLDSSFLTRCPQPPRRVRWLPTPVASPSISGFIRYDRLATLTTLTRLNRVRLRYGSRVCLARLRVGDYSHSTRLRGYVDERVIPTVSSFQLTRRARFVLALRSGVRAEPRLKAGDSFGLTMSRG